MPPKRALRFEDAQEEELLKDVKNHLLVIGIDQYIELVNLNNAVKDATEFRDLLLKSFKFEKESLTELYNHEATHDAILESLKSLSKSVKSNENVVIYFSGHGHFDEFFEEGYWIPVDAGLDKLKTYFSYTNIIKAVKKIRSRHTLLIADSCYSGAVLVKKVRRKEKKDPREKDPSRWLLASGRNEVVADGDSDKNSPFAEQLLDTLGRYSEEGISVLSLVDKVTKATIHNSRQKPIGRPLIDTGDKGGIFYFWPKKFTFRDPDKEEVKLKLKALEEEEWNKAESFGSIDSYKKFLKKFSVGHYAEIAKFRIGKLSLEGARLKQDLKLCKVYLTDFPEGDFRDLIFSLGTKIEGKKFKEAESLIERDKFAEALSIYEAIKPWLIKVESSALKERIKIAKAGIVSVQKEESLKREKKKRLTQLKRKATISINNENYDEAILCLEEALLLTNAKGEKSLLEEKLISAKAKREYELRRKKFYNELIEEGDKLNNIGEYEEAIVKYREAKNIGLLEEQKLVEKKIHESAKNAKKFIAFQKYLNEVKVLEDDLNYSEAIVKIKAAKKLYKKEWNIDLVSIEGKLIKEKDRIERQQEAVLAGDNFFEQGLFEDAIKSWEIAIKLSNEQEKKPIEVDIKEARLELKKVADLKELLQNAELLFSQKKYDEANTIYVKAQKIDLDDQQVFIEKRLKEISQVKKKLERLNKIRELLVNGEVDEASSIWARIKTFVSEEIVEEIETRMAEKKSQLKLEKIENLKEAIRISIDQEEYEDAIKQLKELYELVDNEEQEEIKSQITLYEMELFFIEEGKVYEKKRQNDFSKRVKSIDNLISNGKYENASKEIDKAKEISFLESENKKLESLERNMLEAWEVEKRKLKELRRQELFKEYSNQARKAQNGNQIEKALELWLEASKYALSEELIDINQKIQFLEKEIQKKQQKEELDKQTQKFINVKLVNGGHLFQEKKYEQAINEWQEALKKVENLDKQEEIKLQIEKAKIRLTHQSQVKENEQKRKDKLKNYLIEGGYAFQNRAFTEAIGKWEKALQAANFAEKPDIQRQINRAKEELAREREKASQESKNTSTEQSDIRDEKELRNQKRVDKIKNLKKMADSLYQIGHFHSALVHLEDAYEIANKTERVKVTEDMQKVRNAIAAKKKVEEEDRNKTTPLKVFSDVKYNPGLFGKYTGSFRVYRDRFQYSGTGTRTGKHITFSTTFSNIKSIAATTNSLIISEKNNKSYTLEINSFGIPKEEVVKKLKKYAGILSK